MSNVWKGGLTAIGALVLMLFGVYCLRGEAPSGPRDGGPALDGEVRLPDPPPIVMQGYTLTALYGRPADTDAFLRHYTTVHVPLTLRVPGVRAFWFGQLSALDATQPPPYAFAATIVVDDAAAFDAMLASPEAQAAMADVPNLATDVRFAVGPATFMLPADQVLENVQKLTWGRSSATYHRLVVFYGTPTSSDAFLDHYQHVHVPATLAVPGIDLFVYGPTYALTPSDPAPPFYVASIFAADGKAFTRMLASPQAQAAIADVPNYATGGAAFVDGDVTLYVRPGR